MVLGKLRRRYVPGYHEPSLPTLQCLGQAPCKLHGNLLPLRCSGGGQPDRYLVPSTTSNRNTLVSFKRGSSGGLPWGHRPWLVSSADFGGDGGKSCVVCGQ
ncbi:hypothetical protein CSPX01_15209 [Colletotrichum filicis]|nr:hypothetical protein CSPX01_15209 [Colletotrichum filicis]